MKTKTLFAAILTIGIVPFQCFSAEHVVPLCGLSCLSNPLNAGPAGQVNRADHVIPYRDGDNIQIWTGMGWETWFMDSLSSTGWYNSAGNQAALTSLPVLGPGKGFFYGNNSGAATITFSGTVRTGTNAVTVPIGLSALGSPLALAGPVTSVLGLPLQTGNNIQKWNCDTSSWDAYLRDSLSETGWSDSQGADCPEPTIAIGEGFFFGNNTGTFNWIQILNP
ncbi:MAG TPA: hypothetical protein VFZ59_02865 [Verrucomicrobiae bacterium]|nr:hypothetical protein [Verrucomicrobiae bacterium]